MTVYQVFHCIPEPLSHHKGKTLSREETHHLSKLIKEHNQIQMGERNAYHKRALEGSKHPEEVLSIIMDNMQQKMIPHIFPYPKFLSSMMKLSVNIFGILNHSDNTS